MNFYTVFMLFSGVSISAFLRQTKNRLAEIDFRRSLKWHKNGL